MAQLLTWTVALRDSHRRQQMSQALGSATAHLHLNEHFSDSNWGGE